MHVSIELCVIPMGEGVSVSPYVAACQRVFKEAGLSPRMHAYGTNVEGEWDQVFAAVKRCHQVVHDMGVARIFSTLKVGTRVDRAQSLDDKVTSVRRLENGA